MVTIEYIAGKEPDGFVNIFSDGDRYIAYYSQGFDSVKSMSRVSMMARALAPTPEDVSAYEAGLRAAIDAEVAKRASVT